MQIPYAASRTHTRVRVSMGAVVIINVAEIDDPAAEIAETDKLLYQAKQTRNTYCLQVI
jgi:PleD family two-component response regulator